jgi:transcription antitermination factor NusG
VSTSSQLCESSVPLPGIAVPCGSPQWYAIHTRARHEKAVVAQMQNHGITTFLPLVTQVHRWSDRRKVVQLPLFSCYAFVRLVPRPEFLVKVLQTDGVLRFVGPRGEGVAIPDGEVENIRTLLASSAQCTSHPFLTVGQRVRIRGGSLDGIKGILISRNGDRTLVISVEPIQRSLAVSIDDYQVEAI